MYSANFKDGIQHARDQVLRYGADVDPGRWQGVETKGRPDMVTKELLNFTLEVPVYRGTDANGLLEALAEEIQPNLPWADDHFSERVSRQPTNPGEEYVNWPWWRGQDETTMERGSFTHTYQERFWPKRANPDEMQGREHWGIRYKYGDLDDVVKLLERDPMTRQATFPIFFPEDTGAVHGGRVPCTLHYHFLLRNGMLHLWYPIRSCDLIRHFQDDLYLACRLMIWVLNRLRELSVTTGEEGTGYFAEPWGSAIPGHLYFTAYSLHVHHGDLHRVRV